MDIILGLFLLFILSYTASSVHICKPCSCSITGPEIRFPFWLADRQSDRCGYPGFDLSCNNQSQTILNLPLSGEFLVTGIDYASQSMYINDPNFCLPKRLLDFSLLGTRFRPVFLRNYTFFNCSLDWSEYATDQSVPLYCLSGNNNTCIATRSDGAYADSRMSSSCKNVSRVSVPVHWTDFESERTMDFSMDLQLIWGSPRCWTCAVEGGICGFKDETTLEIGCAYLPRRGLPKSAEYEIIVGAGLLAVCIIGLLWYSFGRIRQYCQGRQLNTAELSTTTIAPQRPVTGNGLDRPTIESYPKTVLGDSGRLPNPIDGTCSICLCEYQPNDALRTLPECDHYFHASCIDQWLRLNATCPLCRISPVSSSMMCPWSPSLPTTSPMPPL